MGEAIIRAAHAPVRLAGGALGLIREWLWVGWACCAAFGGALLGERILVLLLG